MSWMWASLVSVALAGPSNNEPQPANETAEPTTEAVAPLTAPVVQEEAAEESQQPKFAGFEWEGSLTAVMTISRGNTNKSDYSIDGRLSGRGDVNRIVLTAGYNAGRAEINGNDQATARATYGSADYHHFLNEEQTLYGFAGVEALKDSFQQLDFGYKARAGIGKQWREDEVAKLATEVGVAYVDYDYANIAGMPPAVDLEYLAGYVSLDYLRVLTETTEFFHNSKWYPQIEGGLLEEHLVNSLTGIRAKITDNINMEAKVFYDWNTQPAAGLKRSDVRYVLGVNLSF